MSLRRIEDRVNTEVNYFDDARIYIDIRKRYDSLEENDFSDAYELMKDSLATYDRWSRILFDIRKNETKETRDPALKSLIEDMCRILKEINQECRMLWNKGNSELNQTRH